MMSTEKLIKDKCDKLINYITSKGGGEMMKEIRQAVEVSYVKGKKTALNRILKDLTEWASGLTSDGESAVSKLLEEVHIEEEKIVAEILSRENDKLNVKEYKLLENYVNKNWEILDERGEIEKYNRILNSFQQQEE